MSKRLKTVVFILLGIVLAASLAVGAYFLITSASSATVYNLQILNINGEPVSDTQRFLSDNTSNTFPLKVEIDSTSGKRGCYFVSSDPTTAKVTENGEYYYVEYFRPGSTIITAYSTISSKVYDSFKLDVFDNYVADIKLLNQQEEDTLHIYGDGAQYKYRYQATGIIEDQNCNNMLMRVVDNYDKTVLEKISLNQKNKEIVIKTKRVPEDSFHVFYIQTYYLDVNNQEHIVHNHPFYVNVTGYRIDDIQLIVNDSDDFSGADKVLISNGSNPSDVFLLNGEEAVTKVVLSQNVDDIYFKIRIIYSNKSYQDISSVDGVNKNQEGKDNGDILKISSSFTSNMNCWYAQFDQEKLKDVTNDENTASRTSLFDISYTQTENSHLTINKEFQLTYEFSEANSYKKFLDEELYVKVVNSNGDFLRYEYIYWDKRYRRTDTKTNANKEIIGFTTVVGTNPDNSPIYYIPNCSTITQPDSE